MSWFRRFSGKGRDKRKKNKERHYSLPNEPKRNDNLWFNRNAFEKKNLPPADRSLLRPNMNVRQVYSLPENTYKLWVQENAEQAHFLMTPFIDNIYKVHRPGKLTYRRGHVPIQEIATWCKKAQAERVTDAFVLLPDKDLDEYYGIYNGNTLLKSGKEILFDVYDAYGIKVHQYPIQDFGIPQLSKMISICQDLKQTNAKASENGNKIVVHCSAGIGRTGLVTSCYLVYTDRLTGKDIDTVQMEKWTKAPLTDMQSKIWYDTTGQLDFIAQFAEIKDKYDKEGKKLDDPEVIGEVKLMDINKQKEWERKEQERREQAQKIDAEWNVKPSKQKEYVPGETDIDDWWSEYSRKTRAPKQDDAIWVKDENGNWYNVLDKAKESDIDAVSEGNEVAEGNEFVADDIPPDDYIPTWDRDKAKELKRRQNKRNYYDKPLDLSDEGHDEYYKSIVEFPVEEMDDEEWVRRFGENMDYMFKSGQEADNFDSKETYNFDNKEDKWDNWDKWKTNYSLNDIKIESVTQGLFRGKRPGYPSRKLIDEEVIEKYSETLANKGITDIFVLLNNNEINTYYDNALFGIYEQYGLRVHHHPIEDFSIPTFEQALDFCEDLDRTISAGGNCLVHCSAGMGRTGMMVACYEAYKGLKISAYGQNPKQNGFIESFAKWVRS